MTLSRREHLQCLGSLSIGALAAAACSGTQEKPAAPAQSTPFHLYFVGLQLFALRRGQATVSMPKAPEGYDHQPYLLVLGGRVESSLNPLVIAAGGPFGVNAYGVPLSGYALSVDRPTHVSQGLVISDDPIEGKSEGCKPMSADDWVSMRFITDANKLYPKARLRQGWDGNLAVATVALAHGTLKAMPGGPAFEGEWEWRYPPKQREPKGQLVHKQRMTGAAVWSFDASIALQVKLAPLAGASSSPKPATVTISRDTTGPVISAVLYVPMASASSSSRGSHAHISDNLFDGLPEDPTQRVSPHHVDTGTGCTAIPDTGETLEPRAKEMLLGMLLQILNDGTPQCPPKTIRT